MYLWFQRASDSSFISCILNIIWIQFGTVLKLLCRHFEKECHLRDKCSQFVCVCVCLSPASLGSLKVMPSPCSASWRAAIADGCSYCCCTVCLALASLTAGHWLSGTAMPHLLEPPNTNTSNALASQYQSRENFRDKLGARRQVL